MSCSGPERGLRRGVWFTQTRVLEPACDNGERNNIRFVSVLVAASCLGFDSASASKWEKRRVAITPRNVRRGRGRERERRKNDRYQVAHSPCAHLSSSRVLPFVASPAPITTATRTSVPRCHGKDGWPNSGEAPCGWDVVGLEDCDRSVGTKGPAVGW